MRFMAVKSNKDDLLRHKLPLLLFSPTAHTLECGSDRLQRASITLTGMTNHSSFRPCVLPSHIGCVKIEKKKA